MNHLNKLLHLSAGLVFTSGLLLGTISCGEDTAPPSQHMSTPTMAAPFAQTPLAAPLPVKTQAQKGTPEPTPPPTPVYEVLFINDPTDFHGASVASLEERVYTAEVIVRARFVSTSSDMLNFEAVEYLKGTGPSAFTVKAETAGRNTTWDRQDAMLFLDVLSGQTEDFEFADTTRWDYVAAEDYATAYTGNLPVGFTLGTRNPVWLPVESSGSGTQGASTRSAQGRTEIITDMDAEGTRLTVSEAKLQDTVRWVNPPEGPPSGAASKLFGSTIKNPRSPDSPANTITTDEYNECVQSALMIIRYRRDGWAHYGPPPDGWSLQDPILEEASIESGAPKGQAVYNSSGSGGGGLVTKGYDRLRIFGGATELFAEHILDDDNEAGNGYSLQLVTTRPLPQGTHSVQSEVRLAKYLACGFSENLSAITYVTAIAPPNTMHEAFFDPATTTAGIGYLAGSATTTGVLEPAGFSVRGRAIAITGLTWHNGQVVLTVDRFGSWLDGFSFIEPDGSFGLVLSGSEATADRAAGTLTWPAPERRR